MPQLHQSRSNADTHNEQSEAKPAPRTLLDVDMNSIPSPTLARLIEEVRNDENISRSYNRTYNRHNR